MKLPSLHQLVKESTETYVRFPFTLLDAFVGTVASIALINRDFQTDPKFEFLTKIALVSSLGISFFTAIVLITEKWKWSATRKLVAQLGGSGLLILYFFSLPANFSDSPTLHLIRYCLFFAGLHFFVAFAPYTAQDQMSGFWQYNKSLFLRFLTALLYSGVLYVGLVIALLAVEHLFNFDIPDKRYFQLWTFIGGVFNTWFFLAGVPKDLDALELETEYPKGLKIFTQYILIPLVIIYLLILYTYMGKIIIEWNLPKGWVSYLILGFSITGILSLLLVHPIRDRVENTWIRTFSKRYYLVLVPLVIMLFLSIMTRISEYGMTERRYYVLVLAFWLTAVVVYFIARRVKSIKVIPTSLCIIALCSSFGPWGAFSISENNQLERLEEVLRKSEILIEGKVRTAQQKVSFEDAKRISSVVRYLTEVHGVEGLQPWFEAKLDTSEGNVVGRTPGQLRYYGPRRIVGLMGVDYIEEWESVKTDHFDFGSQRSETIEIKGYNYLIRSEFFSDTPFRDTLSLDGKRWEMSYAPSTLMLTFTVVGSADTLTMALRPFIDALVREQGRSAFNYNIPPEIMSLARTGKHMRVKMYFHSVRSHVSKEKTEAEYMEADILLSSEHR